MPETAILVGSLLIGGEHDKASIWVRQRFKGDATRKHASKSASTVPRRVTSSDVSGDRAERILLQREKMSADSRF